MYSNRQFDNKDNRNRGQGFRGNRDGGATGGGGRSLTVNAFPRVILPEPVILPGTLKKCQVTQVTGHNLTIYVVPEDAKEQIDKLSEQMEGIPADDSTRVKHPRPGILVRVKVDDKWKRGTVIPSKYGTVIALEDEGRVFVKDEHTLYFINRYQELTSVPKFAVKCTLDQIQVDFSYTCTERVRKELVGKDFFVYFKALIEDRYLVSMHEVKPVFNVDDLFITRTTGIKPFEVGSTLSLTHIKENENGTFTGFLSRRKQVLSKMEQEAKIVIQDFNHKMKFDSFSLTTGTLVMHVSRRLFSRGIVTQETSDGVSVEIRAYDRSGLFSARINDLFPLVEPFDQEVAQSVDFVCESGVAILVDQLEEKFSGQITVSSIRSDGCLEISSFSPAKESFINGVNENGDADEPKKKKKKSKKNKEAKEGGDQEMKENTESEDKENQSKDEMTDTEEKESSTEDPSQQETMIRFGRGVKPSFDRKSLSSLKEVRSDLFTSPLSETDSAIVCVVPSQVNPVAPDVTEEDKQSFASVQIEVKIEESESVSETVKNILTEIVNEVQAQDEGNKVSLDLSSLDLDESVLSSYSSSVDNKNSHLLEGLDDLCSVAKETEKQVKEGNLIDLSF